jgi:hypothetical protein
MYFLALERARSEKFRNRDKELKSKRARCPAAIQRERILRRARRLRIHEFFMH